MAIFPRRAPGDTMKMFKPLAVALSQEVGVPVKLVVSKDFPTFWKGVKSKQFDIVHFSPYHFLLAEQKFGYTSLVQNEEAGANTLSSVIYVRKDSGITSAADLKGKKILFGGGKKALFSYIGPTYILRQSGLQAGDYTEKIAKNPFGAVLAAHKGAADAGCASNLTIGMAKITKRIQPGEMITVGSVGPLPQLLWATGERVDTGLKGKIEGFFLNLKGSSQGDALLKGAKITNFTPVTDYTMVREVVNRVTGENF